MTAELKRVFPSESVNYLEATRGGIDQIKGRGWCLVAAWAGPQGCGKTRAASVRALELKAQGIETLILDTTAGEAHLWARLF